MSISGFFKDLIVLGVARLTAIHNCCNIKTTRARTSEHALHPGLGEGGKLGGPSPLIPPF